MTLLITGATGNVGGRVVEHLLRTGQRPRVFVRDRDKARQRFGDRAELVAGSLDDASALIRALTGIEALFLLDVGPELAARNALAAHAARAAGVRRIVKLSSLDARSPELQESTAAPAARTGLWHARGEAAIRQSGVPWTFLQPGGFMSNALGWAASIRARGVVRASTGDGKIALVHPDDIADVAVRALTSSDYEGQALALTGPQALSYGEMLALLARVLGQPLRFEAISDGAARQQLLFNGMPEPHADALVALWRGVRENRTGLVTDSIERVLGRSAAGFEQWARENVAAFR